jgi:uncharacterized protein YPO0396
VKITILRCEYPVFKGNPGNDVMFTFVTVFYMKFDATQYFCLLFCIKWQTQTKQEIRDFMYYGVCIEYDIKALYAIFRQESAEVSLVIHKLIMY